MKVFQRIISPLKASIPVLWYRCLKSHISAINVQPSWLMNFAQGKQVLKFHWILAEKRELEDSMHCGPALVWRVSRNAFDMCGILTFLTLGEYESKCQF